MPRSDLKRFGAKLLYGYLSYDFRLFLYHCEKSLWKWAFLNKLQVNFRMSTAQTQSWNIHADAMNSLMPENMVKATFA